jgi:uncharacterized membrane protein
MTRSARGRWWHRLFEASLVLKGLLAGAETATGLGLLLVPNSGIKEVADWLTRNELAQDPSDWMARTIEAAMGMFSIETQHFYALYLLSHGALKLAMVLLLARGIRWAYPAAMLLLAGFILYQLDHWRMTRSPVLLLLSVLDAVMIVLTWHEYRTLRSQDQPV